MSEAVEPGVLEPDALLPATTVDGEGAEIRPEPLPPVGSWSEVDPEYEEFADGEDESPAESDELTPEEEAHEPLVSDPLAGPEWVTVELWGRNLDEGTDWEKVAEQDVDGDAHHAVVPDLQTSTWWEFRLRLRSRDGDFSKWSDAVGVTTPRDLTPPPWPVGFEVLDTYGRNTGRWGGQLAAAFPGDFSHCVLWLQQMHPLGDPDGAPGDPRRVAHLHAAGEHPFHVLAAGVPHRSWLTAVDTSGNESERSEVIEFVPSPPVDEAEIRRILDEAEQERQEYRDAFDERTAEYDRLMLEHEDLLASSDAHSASAMYRADQVAAEQAEVRVQASEAARVALDAQAKYDAVATRQDATEAEIEAARAEAAAAHAAAGEAQEYAAATRASVDGLRPIQSTNAPTGTGQDGQLWERFNTMGNPRQLTGSWRWQDGVWNQIQLSTTYLPMADISALSFSYAQGQDFFAERAEIPSLVTHDLIVQRLINAPQAVINQLFTDTTVATSVWSQIVRTRLLEANEALIGGALIKEKTLTIDHIQVTEDLIFNIARGIRLEVGALASNDIVGMTVKSGRFEGGSILIGTPDTAGQPGFEVDTQGRMRATEAEINGAFQTRPGGVGGDSIAIDRTAWLGGNGDRPYLRFDATYNGYSANPGITTNPDEGLIIYGGDPSSQIGTGAQITMNPQRLTISPGVTGQIRFDGMLTSSAYAAVATGATGSRNVGTGGVNMFVNYFVPLPHGQRFVTATAEASLARDGRVIGTTIYDKDGSGFNVLMRRVDVLDSGTTGARLNWIAARTNVS